MIDSSFLHRGHDLGKHRPLVQRDPLLDPALHQRREPVGVVGEKHQKRVEVERLRAELHLVIRQRHLADRDLAATGTTTARSRCRPTASPSIVALAILLLLAKSPSRNW